MIEQETQTLVVRRIESEYSVEDETAFDALRFRMTIKESQPLTTIQPPFDLWICMGRTH